MPSPFLKIAAALILSASVAACSNTQSGDNAFGANGPGGAYGAGGYGPPGSAKEFSASIGDRVFFETDSTDLTSTAVATLDKQAAWLNRYNQYRILIEGHADERGTRDYNYSLGSRRAQTVRDYLTTKGVASSRLRTVTYGKERPVAVCNDISCWSQNRRAVTVLEGGAAF